MVFDLFLLRDNQNDLFTHNTYVIKICNALFNQFQRVVERCQRIRKRCHKFENKNSMLESVANGLKYVATQYQCIFQRVFNTFSTYLLCQVFANRVTFGECDISSPRNYFNCKINKFFLHSISPVNFLTQAYHCPFLFCKVLYSKLSNKLAPKCNIGLGKKVNNNGLLIAIIT